MPALGERLLVDARDAVRAGHVGRLAVDLAAHEADDRLGRLVLRPHQLERRVLAEVAAPHLVDPVGIRVLERAFGELVEQLPIPSARRRMTAFVNGTARSSRAARTSSTDSFAAACGATSR